MVLLLRGCATFRFHEGSASTQFIPTCLAIGWFPQPLAASKGSCPLTSSLFTLCCRVAWD